MRVWLSGLLVYEATSNDISISATYIDAYTLTHGQDYTGGPHGNLICSYNMCNPLVVTHIVHWYCTELVQPHFCLSSNKGI